MSMNYEKPIISIDTGMAEGIYAASGATTNTVTFSKLTKVADWGSNNGQLNFTADLSSLAGSQLTLIITFNTDVASLWGSGASVQCNVKTATLYWHSAPSTAELTVQVNTNLHNVAITGYTYSTQA